MLKQILTAISTSAVLAACTQSPQTTGNFRNQGYLQDAAGGNAVVRSLGYDTCVRTSDWTPARAIMECDPDLVPKPVVKAPPAPPPKPKVEAPPPPKVAAPPPPKPQPQRYTLSTDALFDFDKTVLKPEGRKKLDDLADSLRGTQYETIAVTGHTDRVGSDRYNQVLSERRADAVKKYLLGKGLDVGKMSSSGKGKTQPVTKPGQCRSGTAQAIIACLQPDRRVEIEAAGTKLVETKTPPAAKPEAKPEAAPAPKK